MASPVNSPVPQRLYPFLAVSNLSIGLALSAAFFIYEVTKTKYTRKLSEEVMLAGLASFLLVCHKLGSSLLL
ncbi:hypothetical protein ABBQ32_007841 [Trebouxia sp. C0010 RCD-2024]